ncbi:MAG: acyl-CoA thioesterase [Anaerolineales bacterium]|nr:acyl-CoA thioesterase [Anaerolineales bacterium]
MDTVETSFYVRYAETDAMGIVHHSSYIIWFEEGRSSYLREKGCSNAEFEASGYYLTVSEVEARYIAPASYGDRVTIRTKLESLRSRSLSMTYQVIDADSGKLFASGRTKHICIDHQGRVSRIPEDWLDMLLEAQST